MCEYCHKFTQLSYPIKEGENVDVGYEGEIFIDLFNNLTTHLDSPYSGRPSLEISFPIKYCPWCGNELK